MVLTNDPRKRMIRQAIKSHKKIYPCADRQSLQECFTNEGKHIYFWFNTEDQSTHVLYEELR